MVTTLVVGSSLVVLIAVGVLIQTMDDRERENRQREAALNARASSFDYKLNGFPPGLVHPRLKGLVCHCLIDVSSQLNKIAPQNQNYRDNLATAQQQLTEFSGKTGKFVGISLSNKAQIKEVQKMFSSLHNFVAKLTASQRIKAEEANLYRKLIQRLLLQTTLDELIDPIAEALNQGNIALAIHYLQASKGKMEQENEDGFYNDRISRHKRQIEELMQQNPLLGPAATSNPDKTDQIRPRLSNTDDSWKKKSYDD